MERSGVILAEVSKSGFSFQFRVFAASVLDNFIFYSVHF